MKLASLPLLFTGNGKIYAFSAGVDNRAHAVAVVGVVVVRVAVVVDVGEVRRRHDIGGKPRLNYSPSAFFWQNFLYCALVLFCHFFRASISCWIIST